MKKFGSVLLVLLTAGIVFIGCKDDDDTTIVTVSPNYTVTGTVTGKVSDYCTGKPVEGAVVSMGANGGVYSATTDASGSYSFANVPAGEYQTADGDNVYSGTYQLTYSLVNVNGSIPDTAAKYRDYYYQSVEIVFTNPDSSEFVGLVGSATLLPSKLGTTVTGVVVDKNEQPVQGATVYLTNPQYSHEFYKTAATDANGKYAFTSVDNGGSVKLKAVSADGMSEGTSSYIDLGCGEDINLRAQVTAERIKISAKDDVKPFVTKTTPEYGADVAVSGFAVVLNFSEPVKQTPYTSTAMGPAGYETMMNDLVFTYNGLKKTSTSELQVTASWNAGYTQLTFTPAEVAGSAKYTFNASAILANFTDESGNAFVDNASLKGDFEDLQFTTNGNSVVPAAPVIARRTGFSYGKLDYFGGTVGLEWDQSADAAYYNVYRKVGSGPYELVVEKTAGRYCDASTGVLYSGTAANPKKSVNVSFKVTALSADLVESASSNVVTVGDETKPTVSNYGIALIEENKYTQTVTFGEPMDMASVQNSSNYLFQNLGTVSLSIASVEYKEYVSGGSPVYEVVISFTTSDALPGTHHFTVANVKDLSGNVIDTDQLY